MQVAHHNDHITHAVIGGQQAIEFGISNSAEFFNILSSTLYKDQILAVVREVLCNAWDAHIEAGCTNRPVLITLTRDKFTIQDFGKGIHHDDMGLIYGTYGNSTKKNDGKQTGGFGLGCKAPFAYTDHFEVTSCHAGMRTIYNLSKSSAQAMGKPGITPIASFPTTDSGLTVSIRITDKDFYRFNELIQRIARNGDMHMHLNGTKISTLDFDVSKGNFLITTTQLLDQDHRIMLRYGNVVYPVDADKNEAAFSTILAHLNALEYGHAAQPFSIVFQAPPHSISVTPSRETLSMQDHTVNTLRQLFKGFLDSLAGEFQVACQTYTEAITKQAIAEKRVDELLKREPGLPRITSHEVVTRIVDFDVMAKVYMHRNYPKGLAYRKQDVSRRLEGMTQENLLDRGKASTFLRELKGVSKECTGEIHWRVSAEATNWLQRRVVAPLLAGLIKAGMPTSQLFTCGTEDHNWHSNSREGVPPLVPATQCSPHHLLVTLPYLRNIVVISSSRHNLVTRAYEHEIFKAAGKYHGFLVYIPGRKKGDVEAARQFFAQQGMRVADLTLKEEEKVKNYPTSGTPRKPANKGVVKLSSVALSSKRQIDITQMTAEDADRIEDPLFILQVSLRSGKTHSSFDGWNRTNSATLVRLFGAKGGITNNSATYNKWREKGVRSFEEYIRDRVCSYILNNPRIEAYWANLPGRVHDTLDGHYQLVRLVQNNEILSKEYGLVDPTTTEEDREYFALWDGLRAQYNAYNAKDEVEKVRQWLHDIPSSANVVSFMQKLKSPLLRFLDIKELRYVLTSGSPHEVQKAVELLIIMLNT